MKLLNKFSCAAYTESEDFCRVPHQLGERTHPYVIVVVEQRESSYGLR